MTTMMVISYFLTWVEIIYSWMIAPKEEEEPSDYL